jgi:TonB family protein
MTSERQLDWMDGLAQALIHRAARRVAGDLSERLAEEWLADMAERRAGFPRLRLAAGCYWATYVIAREQRVAAVAAASPAAAAVSFMGFARNDFSVFSRRGATFLLVASLHAAVFCALAIGLTAKFTKAVIPTPLVPHFIEKHPPIDVPRQPAPKMTTTTIDLPPLDPLPPIAREPAIPGIVKEVPGEATRTDPPLAQPIEVKRVLGQPGAGFPNTADFYPSASIRLEEKGVATVRACVDARGRLTSDPSIVQSSGKWRLDEAALKLAKAGSGHYGATTENGQPVNSCYAFGIRFDLRN